MGTSEPFKMMPLADWRKHTRVDQGVDGDEVRVLWQVFRVERAYYCIEFDAAVGDLKIIGHLCEPINKPSWVGKHVFRLCETFGGSSDREEKG